MFPRLKKFLGIEELSEEEKKQLNEARELIPRFHHKYGFKYKWYYYFESSPIGPYDEQTGEPLGGYTKRELVIVDRTWGNPVSYWTKEKGVFTVSYRTENNLNFNDERRLF